MLLDLKDKVMETAGMVKGTPNLTLDARMHIMPYHIQNYGLGAKYEKNRSVALPRKKNSIAIIHQVYISGAWKTMFDSVICGQFFIINL